MNNILKYLIFFLIGTIIYNIVNHSQGFSIGIPVNDLTPNQIIEITEDFDGTEMRTIHVNGNIQFAVDAGIPGSPLEGQEFVIPHGTIVLLMPGNLRHTNSLVYMFAAINLDGAIVTGWIPVVNLGPPLLPPAPAPAPPAPRLFRRRGRLNNSSCGVP